MQQDLDVQIETAIRAELVRQRDRPGPKSLSYAYTEPDEDRDASDWITGWLDVPLLAAAIVKAVASGDCR